MKISFFLPIKTVSEQHARHGFKTWRRKKSQNKIAALITSHEINSLVGFIDWPKSLKKTILLTRVAPRGLDKGDNLPYSLKWVRDGITAGMKEPDDNAEHLEWVYAQRKGKPKEYGVEVQITIGE